MAELEEATVAAESEGRQALAELAGSLDGLDGVVTIDDDMAWRGTSTWLFHQFFN